MAKPSAIQNQTSWWYAGRTVGWLPASDEPVTTRSLENVFVWEAAFVTRRQPTKRIAQHLATHPGCGARVRFIRCRLVQADGHRVAVPACTVKPQSRSGL